MRLYFLDNIKTALIALVVIHHAGQAYGPTDYWPIRSEEQLALLGPFFEINGAFFMGLFFMISAYFLPASTDRKGIPALLKDRLIRLGIPLLFMTIVVFGPITYFVDGISGSFWSYMIFDYIGTADFEMAHLWFLSLLLFFTLCYAAVRAVSGAQPRCESPAPGHLMLIGFFLALIAANALVRIWFPVGVWVDLVPLMPIEVGRLPQYGGLFVIGLIASRRGWFNSMPLNRALVWFTVAMAAAALHYQSSVWVTLPEWAWPIQEALIGVGFCASLPVFAREFWHQRGTVLDRMAAIAFPVYLIHIIIIYVLQELMETTILGAGMKFATVATLGVLLSFVLSHYLKRVPHLDRVL